MRTTHCTTAKFLRCRGYSLLSTVLVIMLLVSAIVVSCLTGRLEAAEEPSTDLTQLSLEELMSIEVISVSRKAQKVSDAAAAIFVITQEDIRRSGATSIPEALRMVPGLQVARIDANKWAITSRGFNDRFANKLLVLMDGRSVYTPLFSGVYWEVQDTLLEDVERIEVIRGPGATLWGANAVNGVINIITKKAKDTQGGLMTVGGGTEEQGFGGLRYGGELGKDSYYRVYAKYFDRDQTVKASGRGADDDWDIWRAGFRMDWKGLGSSSMTLQGDVYDGEVDDNFVTPISSAPFFQTIHNENDVSGANILGRLEHDFAESSDIILQLYYDWYDHGFGLAQENRHTFDLDLQHRFMLGERNDLIWGLGYRLTIDDLKNAVDFSFNPDSRDLHLFSGFLQDDIAIVKNRLCLTLGSKFEHNDLTGFEFQPNTRLLWTPNRSNSVWMAVSRAVRTPSRGEHDVRINFDAVPPGDPRNTFFLPIIVSAFGDGDFESEELMAYEIGYRIQPKAWLTLDITGFYNEYDHLLTGELGTPFLEASPAPLHLVLPAIADNKMDGETYGVELTADFHLLKWWRIPLSYTYLQMQLHLDPDSTDSWFEATEGRAPHHQVSLRSLMDLPRDFELDSWLRYVDNLPSLDVESYITLDARLGWRPKENLEISIVGQNLLDDRHPEFGQPWFIHYVPTEVEHSVYGKMTWHF